ncbi:MAG: hypothetical protein MJ159_03190 [Treponemataceae bacterium]|nr:hypothetical protein [Treponemataceae bacterium]
MTERARKEYMDYCMIVNSVEKRGEEGVAIGKEEGRTEAKIETGRNMLFANLGTIEQIAN